MQYDMTVIIQRLADTVVAFGDIPPVLKERIGRKKGKGRETEEAEGG
jgi:hypothetical protein